VLLYLPMTLMATLVQQVELLRLVLGSLSQAVLALLVVQLPTTALTVALPRLQSVLPLVFKQAHPELVVRVHIRQPPSEDSTELARSAQVVVVVVVSVQLTPFVLEVLAAAL
jgi:hypothetical protein